MNILKDHNKIKGNRGDRTMSKTKKISIVLLIILIITMCILSVYSKMEGYGNTDRNIIYGYDNNSYQDGVYQSKSYNLKTGNTVYLVQNTADSRFEKNCYPILAQPNVYCVQKGKDLTNGAYTVEELINVTDPILAYILAHSPEMGKLQNKYWNDEAQNALWRYLTDSTMKSDDKKKILNKISCGNSGITKGKDLYKAARAYAEIIKQEDKIENSNFYELFDVTYEKSIKTVTIKLNLKNEVSFRVAVGNKNYISSKNQVSITGVEPGTKIQIAMNAIKKYSASYRILQSENNKQQRLIVVTSIGEAEITPPTFGFSIPKEEEKEEKPQISLEKFITQVNGKTIYDTTYDLNGDGFVDNKDVKYLQNIIDYRNPLPQYTMEDVTKIQKILVKLYVPTDDEKEKYDLNKDGKISNLDLIYIQKIIAGLIVIKSEHLNIEIDDKFDITQDKIINKEDVVALQGWIEKNTRENKRYNKDAKTDLEENKNIYKYDNPVEVGLGDEITYTFKLKNTGDAPITVNYIEDVPEIKNNVKLTYVKQHLRGIDVDYAVKEVTTENGKLKVVFDSPAEIDVGGEVYVDLIFKTEPLPNTSLNTDEVKKLENKASVTINGLTPDKDSDGDENNSDSDFIKVKKPAVSLEKFVSKVNNTNIYIDDSDEPFILQSFDANDDNRVDIQDYELIILYMKGKEVDSRVKERIEREGMAEDLEKLQNVFVRQGIVGIDAILGNREPIDPANFNRRYNDLLSNNNSGNLNTWKKDNPVRVNTGDSVTYTIRIRNTGNTNIKVDTIKDIPDSRLEYIIVFEGRIQYEYDDGTIKLKNAIELKPGEYKDINITFKVNGQTNSDTDYIKNTAYIEEIKNEADIVVPDCDGTDNNRDCDFIKTIDIYKVSLEKYISAVNGNKTFENNSRVGKAEYLYQVSNDQFVDETEDYSEWTQKNWYKYNNVVEVNCGDKVTYTIKLRNDGNVPVYITKIKDYLPDGVEYKVGEKVIKELTINRTVSPILEPNKEAYIDITVTVKEPNISTNVLENTAEITEIQNKNRVVVQDTTPFNNKDSDYIQMKDITIAGMVWNDKALNKTQDNYNGKYDESEENKLGGIKVYLYRDGIENPISAQYTNKNGEYSFTATNINKYMNENGVEIEKEIIKNSYGCHIKGPYESNTIDRWLGKNEKGNYEGKVSTKGYYSYYVVFEYDGITYTSTTFADVTSNDTLDSNAREQIENNYFDGKVANSRKSFNNKFSIINNEGAFIDKDTKTTEIKYDTVNEEGYIPQSIHQYDSTTMAMQSSTKRINLSNSAELEQQLQHVNLGLRGRDIFDLELTSDVAKVAVTVNGQTGVYNNSNMVTLRQSTLKYNSTTTEDMANRKKEPGPDSSNYTASQNQYIRKTDIKNNNYNGTGLGIEVTYKITVQNTSRTQGIATKITNYYDSKYEYKRVELGENCQKIVSVEDGTSGSGYNSKIIRTSGKILSQSNKMEIYVVYALKDAEKTLSALLEGTEKIPTFNMAEITEYKTYTTRYRNGTTNEATRGLLDKDSAPGSANTEKVRLASGTSNDTTVGYYFKAQNLQNLKYEDDTYATPVLYFVASDKLRTIEGTVFEDKTTTNPTTRIKTGDGLKTGEVGVYGATVELVELKTDKNPQDIAENEGTVRYTVSTKEDGTFTISGFLPGYYVIRYRYGDKKETVILGKAVKEFDDEGKITKLINAKSYNGEDFQSTNNTGKAGGEELEELCKLSDRQNFWYLDNENQGVSTATDNSTRRGEVTTYMIGENSDIKMRVLNNIRDGKDSEQAKVEYEAGKFITVGDENDNNSIIKGTKMFANTPNMLFTLEKSQINDGKVVQSNTFGDYNITNMNFGIAEVPVTKVDLQKHIKEFKIVDSTGKNTLAGYKDGKAIGNVIKPDNSNIDVSIEDNLLQGATLTVTFEITQNITEEFNFDTAVKNPTETKIKALVDFVDNNLSYNQTLGNNSDNWEVVQNVEEVEGTSIVPNSYRVILKATENNPIINGGKSVTVTLEKVLSSPDITLAQIITSLTEDDVYNYRNTVEVTNLETNAQRDRVRTEGDRYIFLIGEPSATATSEELVIHPPTGTNGINTTYFMLAAVCLGILVAGVYCIKRFVLTNEKS